MFQELPFLDRFGAAAAAGFGAVEFLFPYEWPADELKHRLADNNLELVLFNLSPGDWAAGERGLTALKGRQSEFQRALEEACCYAGALDCKQLHLMAGLVEHGADRDTYLHNLRLAVAETAGQGLRLLIEPINTFDMPGYLLTKTEEAAEVIREVNAPNLGLQFDLYHRARMEGAVEAAIGEYQDLTCHYQCAAPFDRGEPDCDELDYRAIFKAIDGTGFGGWIGCEYRPRGDTVAGLGWTETCGVSLGG